MTALPFLPYTARFRGEVSAHSAISASFARSRRCAGRAYAGIMTRPGMSRSKCGSAAAGNAPCERTTVFEWHTRVVMRRSTGIFQRSDISIAASVKS